MAISTIKDWEKYWLKFKQGNTPASMEVLDTFLLTLKPEHKIIDIGCGYGRISEQIGELGCNVTGIDINNEEIKEAKHRCKDLSNVQFEVMSGENIQYEENEFDIAILMGTLGGVQDILRKKILSEAYRILKEDCLIYIGELSLKEGDLEREEIYRRDMELTGEYGSRVVYSKEAGQGDILFIGKHFRSEELATLLREVGFRDITVIEHEILKQNIVEKGGEKRIQLSVIGRK